MTHVPAYVCHCQVRFLVMIILSCSYRKFFMKTEWIHQRVTQYSICYITRIYHNGLLYVLLGTVCCFKRMSQLGAALKTCKVTCIELGCDDRSIVR
jgi:hypothetical protein